MTYILGIESSCDETAAAVVQDGKTIVSNVVASQIDLHAQYGGVFPELASRAHVEAISAVVEQAMRESGLDYDQIEAIAVTRGPGLVGSLLVGLKHFDVITRSSRSPAISLPRISSARPLLYASAQSKKLIPSSRQAPYILADSASSASPPKDMVPKQRGDTLIPVLPSHLYSMDRLLSALSLSMEACQFYQPRLPAVYVRARAPRADPMAMAHRLQRATTSARH